MDLRKSKEGRQMEEIKLNRTGQRPIAFAGTEIYNGSTKDRDSIRWDRVRVFETERGYVVGTAKMTYHEEETNVYEVTKTKTMEEVIDVVSNEVPNIDLLEPKFPFNHEATGKE